MKFMKKISRTIFLGVVIICLHGCSSETNQYSPDQVIQNALEELTPAYYGEAEFIINHQGEETEEMMQEWRGNDGKLRIESQYQDGSHQTISVNNGHQLILYEVDRNKAFMIDDPELLSFNQPSLKEQADMLLELLRDTHEISTERSEEVAGRDTHHLVAKAKKSDALFGDVELWIDKETWLVLKMILRTGDLMTEMTYKTIDFHVKMSPDLFTIDLPEDVDIESLLTELEKKEISLEKIPTEIGKPVIYFPETKELKISLIELYQQQSELDRAEVSIDYTKNDLPLLTLSVFETVDHVPDDKTGEIVNIRNHEGTYTMLGEFRSLLWEEDGMTYSIILVDPNLTIEELGKMTEEMELLQ